MAQQHQQGLYDSRQERLSGLDSPPSREILRHPYIRATGILVALTLLLVAAWSMLATGSELRLASYLTLHTFLETCSIVVCVIVFTVARTTVGDQRNRNMVLLGVAFLGVALLDFLHTQSYFGMPALVTPSSPGKAINFWLAARLLAACALLAAAFLSWEEMVPARQLLRWSVAMLIGVAVVAWVFLYWPHWMPETFVPGRGLTAFKIWAEYVIIALSLIAALGFYRLSVRRKTASLAGASFDPVALLAASTVTAMAELFFTIYTDVNGIFNVLGHIYKVIGAWFLYRGLVTTNLFEVETRSRLALEAAQLGAWSWDAATDTHEWDERVASFWGLPNGARPPMSEIDSRIHPDDRSAKQEAMRQALDSNGDGSYRADYRIVRPDGSVRYVESRGRTEFQDERPARVVGVVRDVTERRLAEDAIRESEARLSGILSIAADAIISIDEQHRITLFNQGAERIFGYSSEEAIGQPLDVLLPSRFRRDHSDHIRRFDASGTLARLMGERREIFGLRKDGTEFPAEASISKLEAARRKTFTVVMRDITERKLLEAQLERRVAERTAELTAAFDAIPDGIYIMDVDRKVQMANTAILKLFGYQRSEFVGIFAGDLLASDADKRTATEAWQVWEGRGPTTPVMVTYRRKDGTTFEAMASGNVVRDDAGRVFGRVGLIRDMTDEVKRQKALTQAQRMEAFGQLTGGIAHDFNNLLTVISGNQELLEMRLKDEKDLALLKRAQEASDMGARLTARLLTFARRRQLEPTLLNLNSQIAAMTELLQRSIGEHVILKTKFAARLGMVRADASEIENAILNLAINARDAMPSGGTILIETAEHAADGSDGGDLALLPGRYVRLSVTDTGTGMPPEVARKAFEPFFTTKQPGKGTGLGLSTIHGFAQQSGGTATIYSEVGRGTTVNIYLPQVDETGQPLEVNQPTDAIPPSAGETVLLVEDNPDVREVARKRLEGLGYRVVEAESGPAAIEQLKANGASFQIVFSDVVMPGGMSGYDLGQWATKNAPSVKVLLTSGYPGEMAGAGADALPGVKLLRKPYTGAELARAIRQALDA